MNFIEAWEHMKKGEICSIVESDSKYKIENGKLVYTMNDVTEKFVYSVSSFNGLMDFKYEIYEQPLTCLICGGVIKRETPKGCCWQLKCQQCNTTILNIVEDFESFVEKYKLVMNKQKEE